MLLWDAFANNPCKAEIPVPATQNNDGKILVPLFPEQTNDRNERSLAAPRKHPPLIFKYDVHL
jgi:hypothetical protein